MAQRTKAKPKAKTAPKRRPAAKPPDAVVELARRVTDLTEQKKLLRDTAGDLYSLIVRMDRAGALRLPFVNYTPTMDALLEALRATR